MAVAADLTRQHRTGQLAIRARSLREALVIWRAFDVNEIARTWPTVQAGLVPLIRARGNDSAGLAITYYRAHRAALGITGTATPRRPAQAATQLLITSLTVRGPATAGRLVGQRRGNAADVALVRTMGAVGRHVLNEGRSTLLSSLAADSKARGWSRVTGGNPCEFCAMLADREGVYTAESGDFAAHDHCSCTVEPAY